MNSRHTLRYGAAVVTALAVATTLFGCTPPVSDRPLIVVTTNILGDVVEQIVGKEAEVMTLMRPDADPHSFEISAQEAGQILRADLVVSNGLGLEEGLQQHLEAADDNGVPSVVSGEVVDVLTYSADVGASAASSTESAESTGAADPHFWTDPERMIDVVTAVADAITATVDGVDAKTITRQADDYTEQLRALDEEMVTAFAAINEGQRNLVTNHHVFGYLAQRFDFTVVGAVIPGGSTLAAPSASDLRDLVTAINNTGVVTIFAESSQPDRLVQVLADEAGLDVAVVELFTESLSEDGAGADSYLSMMRTNTERIATGLSP
jgi:zinc/manganese transport system substrate-binding protein